MDLITKMILQALGHLPNDEEKLHEEF